MKLHALMIAVALTAGAAFAQAAPSDTQGSAPEKHKIVKMHKAAHKTAHKAHASLRKSEHLAKAKTHRHEMQARAELRKDRREMHARAERREDRREMHAQARLNTRTLGAGPSVNLNSPSRERRMDAAYADWQARARR